MESYFDIHLIILRKKLLKNVLNAARCVVLLEYEKK